MNDANRNHLQAVIPEWLANKLSFLKSKTESKESFFARVGDIFPTTDARYKLIDRAYDAAQRAFRTHVRDDGEKYFEHLRATALILLVHLRVDDADVIAAALLHDICEDVDGWTHERLTSEFNERVAALVWWLTKPRQSDSYRTVGDIDRKYHRNLRRAPRKAVMIKLADRLHNLLTIWSQDPARVRAKISETKDFIMPLAERHIMLIHELEDALRAVEEQVT
ncbi:MAG TPA: HD domain-containing protein [Candidatus Paceibacterota bacterium]|nr:HD domain-containing protein [Candidatus Paceibacterota bacterium]